MNRLLIVGLAPSRTSSPAEPLSGASGLRLARLAGLSYRDFLARFDRANVFETYTERPTAMLLRSFGDRFRFVVPGRFVVLLGDDVCTAFDFDMRINFGFVAHWDGMVARCPHPSGRRRFWNDPENVARAEGFWRALAFNFAKT